LKRSKSSHSNTQTPMRPASCMIHNLVSTLFQKIKTTFAAHAVCCMWNKFDLIMDPTAVGFPKQAGTGPLVATIMHGSTSAGRCGSKLAGDVHWLLSSKLHGTSGNPCLQGTDGGPARVGWAPLAHRHTQGFFFFFLVPQ